jgi:carboxyl-terminal processing protease
MIKGYVAGLGDPYAAYFAEDDLEGYSQDIQGDYVGLGIVLANEEGSADIIIREVYEDAPAEKAGILAGDILKKVNDKDVSKMDISDIIANEIGKELGTKVALTVARDGKQLTFNTEISRITIKTIDYKMLEDKIGYIKIAEFNQKTTNQFEKALDELTKQEMKGLVIDLRNNPGGLVSSASDMLNMLLPKGVIVTEKDKNNKIIAQVNSDGKHEFKLPLVVLINENSASSSEIFAGALRDYDMCTLVGEKTFGKGIIQGMFELSDGTILKITTSEYFLPKGESIHDKGIEPDVKVKNEPDSDNEEQSKDGKNQADSDKEEQSKDGKNQEQSEKDNQLDRAVEIVKEKISE